MPESRCTLCGDHFHAEPDVAPGWGDLLCPGMHAPPAWQESYRSALASAFAEWVAEQASLCQLCQDSWHAEEVNECPGAHGTRAQWDDYLVHKAWKASQAKIEQTDWDEFGEQAKTAYETSRTRTDGRTKTQLPTDAQPSSKELREHCNQITSEVVKGVPYAPGTHALALPELDLDVPHLTVKGEVPQPGPLARGRHDTLRKASGSEDSDYTLFTKGEHD